jgi:hypothetical protein
MFAPDTVRAIASAAARFRVAMVSQARRSVSISSASRFAAGGQDAGPERLGQHQHVARAARRRWW